MYVERLRYNLSTDLLIMLLLFMMQLEKLGFITLDVSLTCYLHYYVTFIDDATRKTWVYCIRHKPHAFSTFKKWKFLVENETGKKLKCLRFDNGGE